MSWLKKIAEEMWDLRRDGTLIFRGTNSECYIKLQRVQSQSFDWAMKYEGYTITRTLEDWRDSYNWYAGDK